MPAENLFAVSAQHLVLLAGVAFVASVARGFSGFGGALIFIPLASGVVGPRAAAPVLLIIDAIAAAGLIPNAWRHAEKRDVGPMALGAFVGVPIGGWLLARTDPLIIRWVIAAMVTLLLVLLMSGWRYRGRPVSWLTIGVGGIGGLFSGAAQVGGPPIIAYWMGTGVGARTVRANIVLYFAISTVFSIVAYAAGALLKTSLIALVLVTGPAYAAGLYLGSRLFGLVSDAVFRRICYAMIAAAVVLSLPILD